MQSTALRTVYAVRHGQADYRINVDPAAGEQYLTELGREQAKKLADYLKTKGFHGAIFCSPLLRTLETASFVAKAVGSPVTLCTELQEIAPYDTPVPRGMTMAEILERFPGGLIRKEPSVQPGWRLFRESREARMERIRNAWNRILAESKGDILLVSHGGIVEGLADYLHQSQKAIAAGDIWNCGLFLYTLDGKNRIIRSAKTTEYLPEDMITDNSTPVPAHDDGIAG